MAVIWARAFSGVYNMTLYDRYPFGCYEIAKEPAYLRQTEQDRRNGFHLVMPTRYFILLLVTIFICGLTTLLRTYDRGRAVRSLIRHFDALTELTLIL